MDLLEKVKSKYLDDIANAVGIHQAIIFVIFLATLLTVITGQKSGVWSVLINVPVSEFIPGSDLLKKTALVHILVAVLLVLFNSYAFKKIQLIIFDTLSKRHNLHDYLEKQIADVGNLKSNSEGTNWALAKEVSQEFDKYVDVLKRKNYLGEILLSIIICTVLGVFLGDSNLADFLLAIAAISVFALNQWGAYKYYLAYVVPRFVIHRVLTGQSVTLVDGLDASYTK